MPKPTRRQWLTQLASLPISTHLVTRPVAASTQESGPCGLQLNDYQPRSMLVVPETRIEKPRYPQSRLKGVGIYVFEPAVFDAIRRTPRTALRDEYELTDSIQILITDGYNVRPSNHLSDDINITYPADLCEVNLAALRHESLDYYLADSAVVSPSARVLHSVVGSGAAIADGAHLRNTVVFAGGVVPPGADLDGVIVTESEIFKI